MPRMRPRLRHDARLSNAQKRARMVPARPLQFRRAAGPVQLQNMRRRIHRRTGNFRTLKNAQQDLRLRKMPESLSEPLQLRHSHVRTQ